MKTRFSTIDLFAIIHDMQSLIGMRVVNIYDIDSKTYLIKLQKPDHKAVILFESGIRIHPTTYDWPKASSPSTFSMKLRKHIRQRRLDAIRQLGVDRIVDMQFGGDDRACHVIVELYDRGNILLTDADYVILNVLRPRTDADVDVRFAVREKYRIDLVRQSDNVIGIDELKTIIDSAKNGENMRRLLAPHTHLGPALLEHSLIACGGFPANAQLGRQISRDNESDLHRLHSALLFGHEIYLQLKSTSTVAGYLIVKLDRTVDGATLETYEEFHPYTFAQFPSTTIRTFSSFSHAVDEFFSTRESQRFELRALQQQHAAVKKLENIKNDHHLRVEALQTAQSMNARRACAIELNQALVDRAILVVRSALANQLAWSAIEALIADAVANGDPVASAIRSLALDKSQMTLALSDDIEAGDDGELLDVVIDINLGAYQNARRQYDNKRAAKVKQQKTIDASRKALKSAEIKTQQALQQVKAHANVVKHRKPIWFEKFIWFISSENYLVIGGRDAQQNEFIVKRHLKSGDVYVHADLRGASSVIIKNRVPSADIPPKTLNEAGTMSVCYSAAWDAHVIASAWWVRHDQVTRTAPTGEYLPTGSFMIRGKKNYLPSTQLVMGFGFLFKLDEDSLERHKNERLPTIDDGSSVIGEIEQHPIEDELPLMDDNDVELSSSDDDDDEKPIDDDGVLSEFPDVQVGLRRLTTSISADADQELTILQFGNQRKPVSQRQKYLAEQQEAANEIEKASQQSSSTRNDRRTKHKQLKMKTKYKDQDDEERELRIQLLAAAGTAAPSKQDIKKMANAAARRPAPKTTTTIDRKLPPPKSTTTTIIEPVTIAEEERPIEKDSQPDDEAEDDVGDDLPDDELGVLDTLTAMPVAEDTLLFALPVCAPYQSMSQFKYKVKLTPGTGKRGKACKTALVLFQKTDRSTSARERELLKVVAQEQDIARNMPGKVKLSAPQLNAVKAAQRK